MNKTHEEAFGATVFQSYENAFIESRGDKATRAAWDFMLSTLVNNNVDEYTAALALHNALQQNVRPTLREILAFVAGQIQFQYQGCKS
jgi:hypothetical protein